MFQRPNAALAAVCLIALLLSPAVRADAPPTAVDVFGDPLPPGAVARLGTVRLRHAAACLAWAPDGKALATAGVDGAVHVWDAASGKEVWRFGGQGAYYNSIVYDTDGKRLIAGGADGSLHLLDAATGREGRSLTSTPPQPITALARRADEGTVVTLGHGGVLRVWDPTIGKVVRQAGGAAPGVVNPYQQREAFSPDGRCHASWGLGDLLTVRDDDGQEHFHAPTQFKGVDGLAFSADGKTLAASSAQASQVAFWDTVTGKEVRRLGGVRVAGRTLAFSPNGKYLASLGGDGAVHVWGAASGKDLRQFEAPQGLPALIPALTGAPLAFSPDGKTLAAAQGLAVRLWDIEDNKDLHEFVGHNTAIDDLRFSSDGGGVLTWGRDGMVGQWDAATGKRLAWRTLPEGAGPAAAAGPDGKTVFLSVAAGVARWDLGGDRAAARPLVAGLPGFPSVLCLSADGKTLGGCGPDRFIYVWDAETGKEKAKVRAETPFNPTLALSPDGGLLAIAAPNTPARLWDVAANREAGALDAAVPTPPGAAPAPNPPTAFRGATHLAFAPDGRMLAASSGWELTLWEAATDRERMRVGRFNTQIGRVAFSPDGRLMAAGTTTGAVLLLDAADGWERTQFTGHAGAVTALAFTPDGKRLASGGADGTALIWDVKEWSGRKRPDAELSPEKLSAAWTDLLDPDAGRAYRAVLALAVSPKAAAPLLKERRAPGEGPGAGRVARLIKDLNDDQFEVRENAERDLDKMGVEALPAVRQALASDPPAESRRRLQELLDRHKDAAAVTEEVRGLRAVEALERSGAPEALEALRALTKDALNAAVKRQAGAALERLARRADVP